MLVPVLLFLLGLAFLIKGGDWFVDGATGIAKRFRISEFLIGATVVSIGTTLPEVMVSVTGTLGGKGEMAYGNAIGSVICNTALIAAITVTVAPSKVDKKTFRTPVIFFFTAAVFYSFMAYFYGEFSRLSGIVLLLIFIIYMIHTVSSAVKAGGQTLKSEETSKDEKNGRVRRDALLLVMGAAVVAIGARLLVDNGTIIAQKIGVPESVIALTFVAIGTSLPELVTAITALIKGHGAVSLGNIVGANLFNLVLVSGLSVTLSPFSLPASKTVAGQNASLLIDLPVMLFVMLLLTVPALIRGKLSRFQGILLLAVYAAFLAVQFFV